MTRVKAPDVWALGYTGTGLVVAGADTGVQWDHPALKNHYRGWDGQKADHDYNWHDAVQQSSSPIDPHGHGTFTVSEMVGDDGNGNQIGVAPGAKWIACRNMDSGGNGKPAWYTECFQFLIAPYPIGGDPEPGRSHQGARFHQQFLGVPAQRRLLDRHPADDRGRRARRRNLPCDGRR